MSNIDHVNLIRKIAWSFHNSTGIDWEELYGEASLAYCKGLVNWDSSKGKITTYMWNHINNQLLSYLRSKKADKNALLKIEYVENYDINYLVNPNDFFENLTRDAEEIAEIILRSSGRFVVLTIDEAESRIYSIMKNKGWSKIKIRRALYDLKVACNT